MTAEVPVSIGARIPERRFGPITAQMLVRYSGVSGDLNPMHYDQEFARAAGYPGVFSQGMHHAALLATVVSDLYGAERVRRFLAQFKDQVWLGDELLCRGEITAARPAAGGTLVSIALTVTTGPDRVVLEGEADVLVAGEASGALTEDG
ncbi:MaoC family dehydratase [Agrococcus baldri]|uniref:MaoC-like dehydratase n=1 Tax=Agrococcus baldri TaxID=153730 RepID=A0AA87RK89_9MICO|nr:MaoC/PaaZ C-terminal domain-containing protein [Agrococcus baldri]GEK81670.1 MaoC-like dehydratase [Agrococcus baldri]